MLEKSIYRLVRQNYFNRNQIDENVELVDDAIKNTRKWILAYKSFYNVPSFKVLVSRTVEELVTVVKQLMENCLPVAGKKQDSKKRKKAECQKLCRSIETILDNLTSYFPESPDTKLAEDLVIFVLKEFQEWCEKNEKLLNKIKFSYSKRGKQTGVIPFADAKGYDKQILDKKWFKQNVLPDIDQYLPDEGHKTDCKKNDREYRLKGFRPNPRNPILQGSKEKKKIRQVQCKNCGKIFSVLPSFIAREKHYGVDVIGTVLEGLTTKGTSLQYSKEITSLTGYPVKSKQTILNWLQWIGYYHPAELLSVSGAQSSGYFQEDEGFQKEPCLRTYIAAIVDSETQAVWHLDYIDHVNEETLFQSFSKLKGKISFKIKGVTKDKWQASTNALREVFQNIWLGLCHRHCIENIKKAIRKYSDTVEITDEKAKNLLDQVIKVLKNSTSSTNMRVRLNSLTDEAFKHPELKKRIDELKQNAAHYCANKNRVGIKRTTSIVDNFLKLAKEKLQKVKSFRDSEWASCFFRALANVRNFLPFKPGAKNAHKSPFMLAEGQTLNLPWMQVINFHNGFLFI
jgi:polyhydroxyalkanoate synthesis regulator phasin